MSSNKQPAIKVAISSCLLGNTVRYDGGHKRDPYITEQLAAYFDFHSICPEVAIGLGTPRPPIQLRGDPEQPRAVGVHDSNMDVTAALANYGRNVALNLADISGYIFKKNSPSCGLFRVKVYREKAKPPRMGRGIFAKALLEAQHDLPAEEEGRLNDPILLENFILRVYAYHRWQQLRNNGISPAALVRFHTEHKYILMAHGQTHYRKAGQLIAKAGNSDVETTAAAYIEVFMHALSRPSDRKKHTNVLMHALGYLKNSMGSNDKKEFLQLIENYRIGQVPLVVPLTMLKHYLRRFPDPYLNQQYYLNPYPEELKLRNSI